MHFHTHKKIKILSIVIIASIIMVGMIGISSFFRQNGINIKISVEGEANSLLSTETSKYRTFVQIVGNDPYFQNTSAEVYRGFINNYQIYLNPSKNVRFRNLLNHWATRLGNERFFKDFKTCLIVSIWFISEGVDYRVVPDKGINYNPFKAKNTLIQTTITVKAEELLEINETKNGGLLNSFRGGLKPNGQYITEYHWVINYDHSVIPSDYEDTPIMLLNNSKTVSADVEGTINLRYDYVSRFRVTLAYGFKILNNPSPSLDVWSTDISSLSDNYGFRMSVTVGPGFYRQAWIYIKAKPVILFEEEYKEIWYRDSTGVYYLVSTTPTGYQRITAKISDVDTYIEDGIKKIHGGYKSGFPGNGFMDRFFSSTTIEQPPIEHKILKATNDDQSIVWLNQIIKAYMGDYTAEEAELGIGIPVGAYLAAAVPELEPVVSGLFVSFGYAYWESLRIDGFIQNIAKNSGHDYDLDMKYYVAISNYLYDFRGDNNLRVPAGIYFEFEPVQ